jgi:hypothetical protein
MTVETPSLFAQVIQDHLELKSRNQELERLMPLDHYKAEDPFDNHPLFKTEEQARIEETMDGVESPIITAAPLSGEPVLAWPGEDTAEHAAPELEDSGLWSRSRDFDWGD